MMDWLWKAADRDIQALHAATQQYQCVMLQLIGYAGRVQLIGYCLEGADTWLCTGHRMCDGSGQRMSPVSYAHLIR